MTEPPNNPTPSTSDPAKSTSQPHLETSDPYAAISSLAARLATRSTSRDPDTSSTPEPPAAEPEPIGSDVDSQEPPPAEPDPIGTDVDSPEPPPAEPEPTPTAVDVSPEQSRGDAEPASSEPVPVEPGDDPPEPLSGEAGPESSDPVRFDSASSEPPPIAGDDVPGGVGRAGRGSGRSPVPVQDELDELADPDRLRAAVEAVLLVIDTPTSTATLASVLGRSVPELRVALRSLRDEYDAGGRGMDLREVADGWRLYSRDEFAMYVERFVLDGQQARLTQAALETLAVIAYRQPVTRSRISGIRGVSVDAVMRTLLTRGLVEECGADPDTGGGLYRTTPLFMEKLGLRSLEELPSLAPLLPDTSQLDDVELSS